MPLFLLLLFTVSHSISLTMQKRGQSKCFYLFAETGKVVSGEYIISGERDHNVGVTLTSSEQKLLYSNPQNTREGKFDYTIDRKSNLMLCFVSKDNLQKIISFEFYINEGMNEDRLAGLGELRVLSNIFILAAKRFDAIYRNLQFYEIREKAHRDLAEINCDRIVWMAAIKIVVLLTITFTQMWTLTRFFIGRSNKI